MEVLVDVPGGLLAVVVCQVCDVLAGENPGLTALHGLRVPQWFSLMGAMAFWIVHNKT